MKKVITIAVLWAALAPIASAQDLDSLLDSEGKPAAGTAPAPPPDREAEPAERPETEASREPGAPTTAEPETPEPSRVSEEIIGTAQKRAENIMDVPISMSALGGEFLKDANVADMNDVSLFTPNVKLQVTPNSTFINIRGLGTGENRGFEQSVGLVIDGVYYGRPDYMLGGLLDLERIEVLRGPQGTIFGKNTIAGALNIVTGQPEEELYAEADALVGELDQRRFRGVVTGPIPLVDHLSARFAIERDTRDGYIFNNTPRQLQADEDNTVLRGKLRWLPWDDVEIVLGYDRNQVEQIGDGYQLHRASDETLQFYRQYDPETEADPTNFFTTTDDERSGGERTINAGSLNVNWNVRDFTVTAITGLSDLGIVQVADADFSAAPFIGLLNIDDYRQFSQELRVLSPPGTIEYLAGLYYFQSDFLVRTTFDIAKDGDAPLIAGAAGAPNSPQAALIGAALGGGGVIQDQSRKRFDQDAQAWAAFGQATWYVTDRWSLIGGLRYGQETKEVDLSNTFERTGVLFQAILGEEEYAIQAKRRETDFSPKVSTRYDLTDDVNVYATWAKGFKSGGFNQFAPTAQDVDFGPENAATIEGGLKGRFLDGRVRANVGYFYTDFDDLQVTIFNGTQFVVGNAAQARTQGVELDGTWLALDDLDVTFSGGFTHARYAKYRDAPCWADGDGAAGPNPREREEDDQCFQDLTGERLHRAPDFNAAAGFEYGLPVWSFPVRFITGANVLFQDETFLNLDLDPVDFQDAFAQVNARIGLRSDDDRWSVTVFGRNLTDEVIFLEAADVPLFEGDHFSRQDLPRTIAGEVRLRF